MLILKKSKAVSPLIATVLLVAFSVVLGALVMNFAQKSTKDLSDEASQNIERGVTCSVNLIAKLVEIDDEKFICFNRSGSNNLEAIVENQGTKDAKGVQIFVLDSNDAPYTYNILTALNAHNSTKYNVSLGSSFVFPPLKIIISPIILSSGNENEICTDNRIEVEEIEVCS